MKSTFVGRLFEHEIERYIFFIKTLPFFLLFFVFGVILVKLMMKKYNVFFKKVILYIYNNRSRYLFFNVAYLMIFFVSMSVSLFFLKERINQILIGGILGITFGIVFGIKKDCLSKEERNYVDEISKNFDSRSVGFIAFILTLILIFFYSDFLSNI